MVPQFLRNILECHTSAGLGLFGAYGRPDWKDDSADLQTLGLMVFKFYYSDLEEGDYELHILTHLVFIHLSELSFQIISTGPLPFISLSIHEKCLKMKSFLTKQLGFHNI
jgi:hypothetical protein